MDQAEFDQLLVSIADSLKRLAAGVERISPPPPQRSNRPPAGVEALSRPTLADQAQWERDENKPQYPSE